MKPYPNIPVVNLGSNGTEHLVGAFRERLDLILDSARRQYSSPVLWLGDRIARRWAARTDLAYRDELGAIDAALGCSGAWLLNFSYEWGCTSAVVADPSGAPRLLRTMDWQMPSLGRTLLAVRRQGRAGGWINLTWPGFVGAVQGMAPGRFAAALNQAPSADSGFGQLGDWLSGKVALWRNGKQPPALLLRQVFDSCRSYAEACERLRKTPICASAFYTVAGIHPGEAMVIERTPNDAVVHEGLGAVTNHWLTSGLPGRTRSRWTIERLAQIRDHLAHRQAGAPRFAWLSAPILNDTTRLALETVPASGELVVQGYEADGPATAILTLDGLIPPVEPKKVSPG